MLNTSIPLSGMQAATLQLAATADNIANINSDGALPEAGQSSSTPRAYQPVRVQQSSAGQGQGTTASVTGVHPSFVARYDPSAAYANAQGLVAAPNVDVMNELLNITVGKVNFTANVSVAEAMNQMVKQLFELNQ
jgi:flagellar basal-body rod protein FlgC